MPFNPASKTNKNRTAYRNRTRSNHFVSVKPSSILVQIDESGNSNSPDKNVLSPACTMSAHQTRHQSKTYGSLLSSQGKNTVGIIGGVSVCSTLIFLEKLVWLSSRNGEKECLPFVVCSSDPALNPEIVVDNLWQKRAFLEQSGARCIVMPCSLSHAWHDEISKGCSVTFLHIGDCVAKELKEAKLKPLEAGSNVRIGVLATDETLNAGFYQQKLQNQGFEVVFPDKSTMERIVNPAIEAMNRKDMEGARNLLRIAIQLLLVSAVNTVILASDEMRGLLPREDPLLKKCTDPMDALARSTIRWAQSAKKLPEKI